MPDPTNPARRRPPKSRDHTGMFTFAGWVFALVMTFIEGHLVYIMVTEGRPDLLMAVVALAGWGLLGLLVLKVMQMDYVMRRRRKEAKS